MAFPTPMVTNARMTEELRYKKAARAWYATSRVGQLLRWLDPQIKMKNQRVVMTKQNTDTNITQAVGLPMAVVEATRVHTRPPNTNSGMKKMSGMVVKTPQPLGNEWFACAEAIVPTCVDVCA